MALKEFRYTICPVGNSSYIAANKIWKEDTFEKAGGKPVLLQSLPKENWHVHFDYKDPALFREGGNIPPLWAKSNDADVILIGLAFLEQKSYILVKADSPVEYVEQLRRKRIGIPKGDHFIIDFYRATVEHEFEIALKARGVSPEDVDYIYLEVTEESIAMTNTHKSNLGKTDVEALNEGTVDAIYAGGCFAQNLLATGEYKIIYEITENTEQVLPISNIYPNTLTVSKRLAEENPEIVVEYVKQTLIAAEWAKTHRAETIELFSKQLHGTIGEVANAQPVNFHKNLAVNLSEKALLALEGELRFLYDNKYITKLFDIQKWADDSFLKTALKELSEGR